MTREDIVKAFEMRLDGMTYGEIGVEFAVSEAYIRQLLSLKRGCSGNHKFKCIFPGLTRWMNEHRYTVTQLARELPIAKSRSNVALKLSGIRTISLSEVKAILSLTGLTFEEAFGEEDIPGGESNGSEQQAEGCEI